MLYYCPLWGYSSVLGERPRVSLGRREFKSHLTSLLFEGDAIRLVLSEGT